MKIVTANVSIMLLVAGVSAGDAGDNPAVTGTGYTDTCDYRNDYASTDYVKCGDQCLHFESSSGMGICGCGSDSFHPGYDDQLCPTCPQYCCIPSGGSCTKENVWQGDIGVCSEGRNLSMSSYCDNTNRALQCYNSYKDSQIIAGKSHYTYPLTSVPWLGMCQGVSWFEGDMHWTSLNRIIK